MRSSLRAVICAAILISPFIALQDAFSQESDRPFAGKQISLTINFAAGGPTDLEGRLFGRFLSKHTEGNPPVVPFNREGAGGITGAVALGEQGARDGTSVGYLTGVAWNFAMFPEKFPLSMRQFEYIGFQSGTSVSYVRAAALKNYKSPRDLLGTSLVMGGLSAGEVKDVLLRLTLDILGIRYKYVTGYQSSSAARLAVQRGEIDFHSESLPGYLGAVAPQLAAKGIVVPLFHDSLFDGKNVTASDVPGIGTPAFHEFYEKAKGSKPSGPMWDAYLGVLAANQAAQRLIVLPPQSSQSALKTLRDAVAAINVDPEFAEAGVKLLGFAPKYVTGPETNAKMTAIFDSVTPGTLQFVRDYMKGPK